MSESFTVLVVEDEDELRDIYKDFLEDIPNIGDIILCNSSEDALEKISQKKLHLIISDYSLPDYNGVELFKKIQSKQEARNVPFILVSGYLSEETIKEAKSCGLKYAFTKPVEPQKLEAAINQILLKT